MGRDHSNTYIIYMYMNLYHDILHLIFQYLPNEDIFKLPSICKYYKQTTELPFFFNKIKYRQHPMVFNVYDNLCTICNLRIYFLTDDITFLRCNHY
jgi:hypothetical protein